MVDWKPILVAVVLGPLLVWFVSYGVDHRPIIDYGLQAPEQWQVGQTAYPGEYLQSFEVWYQNKGSTDGLVHVTISVQNASLVNQTGYPLPWQAITFDTSIPAGTLVPRYWTYPLKPLKDTPSFSISCSVEKRVDLSSTSGVVSTLFAEVGKPKTLTYVRVGAYDYKLDSYFSIGSEQFFLALELPQSDEYDLP